MAKSISAIWYSITEPRHLKATYFVIYLLVFAVGVASLLTPPAIIRGEVGDITSAVWSGLFILGSAAGAVMIFPGWWWAERLAIGMILTGIIIYVVIVIWVDLGDGPATRFTQAGLAGLSGSVFYVRYLLIKKYSFEPRGNRGGGKWNYEI